MSANTDSKDELPLLLDASDTEYCPLVNAIENGETKLALSLIDQNANINKNNALWTAIHENNTSVFNGLMEAGVTVMKHHYLKAILCGNLPFVKKFLTLPENDPDGYDWKEINDNFNILSWTCESFSESLMNQSVLATRQNFIEIARCFIENGVDIYVEQKQLFYLDICSYQAAMKNGMYEISELILETRSSFLLDVLPKGTSEDISVIINQFAIGIIVKKRKGECDLSFFCRRFGFNINYDI